MYQDQTIASGSPMEHAIALCFETSLPTLREQASHAVNRHLARHSSCDLRDSPRQHSLSAEGYLDFCRLLSWFRWSRGKHQPCPSDRLSVWAPLLHRCNGTAGSPCARSTRPRLPRYRLRLLGIGSTRKLGSDEGARAGLPPVGRRELPIWA